MATERGVRSLLVVKGPKAIDGPLLGGEGRPGRPTGAGFEGLVHAFVRPVLLG